MRRAFDLLAALALVATPALGLARIDLVTIPDPDRTELTIYSAGNITLVRETRTLAFRRGENRIQFAWTGVTLDRPSLHLDLGTAPGLVLLDTVYPSGMKTVAEWVVEADADTSAPVDIRYFVSGLSWSARYEARASEDETTLAFRQFTMLTNRSGADFTSATTRVVVGEIHLAEALFPPTFSGELPVVIITDKLTVDERQNQGPPPDAHKYVFRFYDAFDLGEYTGGAGGKVKPVLTAAREIVKQAVSEYRLFAVEGETDLRDGWSQELPNTPEDGVAFDLSYELDPRRYGTLPVKFYKFRNDESRGLGVDPLPAGTWVVTRADGRDGIALEGRTSHKYVPTGEIVELNLGADGLMIVEDTTVRTARDRIVFGPDSGVAGYDDVTEHRLEIRNGRSRAVPLRLTQYFAGDWEFDPPPAEKSERIDRETVRRELTVPASSTITLTYRLRTHRGTNAKTN